MWPQGLETIQLTEGGQGQRPEGLTDAVQPESRMSGAVLFTPVLHVASRTIPVFKQTATVIRSASAPLGPALLTQTCSGVPPSETFLHLLIKERSADSQEALRPAHLYQMMSG